METTKWNDDELLSAYIDGELPPDDAAALVERLAREPALVQRLEAMRSGDEAVRAVYRKLDETPLPEGVSRLLDIGDDTARESNVVSLPARGVRRFANVQFAIAASLVLIVGILAIRQMPSGPQVQPVDALVAGRIDAGGEVYDLLEGGVSGRPQRLGEAAEGQIILSFESESGDYCRQLYVAQTGRAVHGVACRDASGWRLEAVAPGPSVSPGGEFQAAATATPEAVSAAVDGLIGANDLLSAEEEKALISTAWKKSSD